MLHAYYHLRPVIAGTLVWLSSLGAPSKAANFKISSSGQSQAEIVVEGETPEAPLAFAAEELQRYVERISGVQLPVAPAPSKKYPIILAIRQQASKDPREEDHYSLQIDARKLQITGASPRAVLFGVYDLLERLGCGWCVPGDDSIPKRDRLEIAPLEADFRPAFQYRMMLDFPMMSIAQTVAICDWLAKNRLNWIHECPNAHGAPKAWYERRDRVVPQLKKTRAAFDRRRSHDAHVAARNALRLAPRMVCLRRWPTKTADALRR